MQTHSVCSSAVVRFAQFSHMTVPTLTRWPPDISDPAQLAVLRMLAERVAYRDIMRGLVHELRQPMQSMIIAAHELMDETGNEHTNRLLDVIRRGSDQSAQSIDLLGQVVGESSDSPGPVLVSDVVNWVVGCERVSRLKIDGEISVSLPPDLPAISAHNRDLATVLTLVVNNARESVSTHGRGDIAISGTFQPAGRGVVLCVEDDGTGLLGDDAEQPFEPFYTTKAGDDHLGLGLPAARALLAAYQAKIRLKPRERGGMRCEIWVPKWERSSQSS